MAYTRRNQTLDLWANRAWTADTTADLPDIDARHGDLAYVTADTTWYLWVDTGAWVNLSPVTIDPSGKDYLSVAGQVLTCGLVDLDTDVTNTIQSWTPALRFGGATTGITYSVQVGTYIKIGRLVYVTMHITLSSKGSATGAASIAGLPVIHTSTTNCYTSTPIAYSYAMNAFTQPLTGLQSPSQSTIDLHQSGTYSPLNDTHFQNTSQLIACWTYPANA